MDRFEQRGLTGSYGAAWRFPPQEIPFNIANSMSSLIITTIQFSSVALSCPTLCNPMNCSTPGLPVPHQLLEFTQIHVHWVGDAIQPSHPVIPFSSCPQPLPASESFQMSQLVASSLLLNNLNNSTSYHLFIAQSPKSLCPWPTSAPCFLKVRNTLNTLVVLSMCPKLFWGLWLYYLT